jgi:hypothetical protein
MSRDLYSARYIRRHLNLESLYWPSNTICNCCTSSHPYAVLRDTHLLHSG